MMLSFFPLLLLLLALGNMFLYQRSSHDVYRVLTASIAIVCLIWGFAIAHWSIHLLCLVLLFNIKQIPWGNSENLDSRNFVEMPLTTKSE